MMKKDNDSIGIIANHFSAILFGDPSRIIIYPPQGKSRGSVVIRERQYEISLLRVTIKDQGKRYEYTEKNLPYIIIFQRGSFLESSDSFLIVGKNWTLLWGSVLQNVELDLTIFATGNDKDRSRILAIRAYFPTIPEGNERKFSDGFVAISRDPRIIVDWGRRIGASTLVNSVEKPPRSEHKGSMEQSNQKNEVEK